MLLPLHTVLPKRQQIYMYIGSGMRLFSLLFLSFFTVPLLFHFIYILKPKNVCAHRLDLIHFDFHCKRKREREMNFPIFSLIPPACLLPSPLLHILRNCDCWCHFINLFISHLSRQTGKRRREEKNCFVHLNSVDKMLFKLQILMYFMFLFSACVCFSSVSGEYLNERLHIFGENILFHGKNFILKLAHKTPSMLCNKITDYY